MLDIFRQGAKTWASRILIWFVALTFVGAAFLVWGQGGAQRTGDAAVVDGAHITHGQLAERARRVEDTLRQQFGAQFDPRMIKALNPPAVALNSLIEEQLALRAAREAGLDISDAELSGAITGMAEFQTGGQFDKARYLDILKANGITPGMFEEQLRAELLANKLRALVEEAVTVSQAELVDAWLAENQPVTVEYALIGDASREAAVDMGDAAMAAWYGQRQVEFQTPERRAFRALVARARDFEPLVTVPARAAEEYYRGHPDEFAEDELVEASHILARVAPDAPAEKDAAARGKIDKALARVRAGEDFAAVARAVSEDPAAADGGDLGAFGRGMMFPQFEAAVFALKPGEVSEPFLTEFGWHIAKVTRHTEARARPLEEVRALVEERVKAKMADDLAMDTLDAAVKTGAAGFGEAPAAFKGLRLVSGEAEKGAPLPQFAEWRPVSDALFALPAGQVSGAVETPGEYAAVIADAITPAAAPPFEQVKEKVAARYRSEESKRLAREAAEGAVKATREGKPFYGVVKEAGLALSVTAPFSRASMAKGEKGEGMIAAALLQPVDSVGTSPAQGGVYVYRVKQRYDATPDPARIEELRESLVRQRRAEVWRAFSAQLRKKAEAGGLITINVKLDKGQV
ncbi:MAG: SurA N-terminal domain-containing protein [Nitrospinae bacterium]|nr:SurA N-terminal domain-containing protein [Nitrospinota bacterium]